MDERFGTAGLAAFGRSRALRRARAPTLDLYELPSCGRLVVDLGRRHEPHEGIFREALGLALPSDPNTITLGEPSAAWLRPGRYLLFCAAEQASRLAAEISAVIHPDGTCVDVSDTKVAFRLCGSSARDCLACVVPIDLREAAFTIGDCAQTHMLQAQALILRTPDGAGYDLHVDRSHGAYAWNLLLRVGREFGLTGEAGGLAS